MKGKNMVLYIIPRKINLNYLYWSHIYNLELSFWLIIRAIVDVHQSAFFLDFAFKQIVPSFRFPTIRNPRSFNLTKYQHSSYVNFVGNITVSVCFFLSSLLVCTYAKLENDFTEPRVAMLTRWL